ncbi:MAG: GntR family transcriptional regulator [Clostridia bacterium]|nr:GntR family transcriptional regulator [Clostridia bacterium]
MAWKFTSDKPVYLQIADRLTKAVLSGEFKPGEQIPSVRQLALDAAVNPNTVQHAFTELENNGLIISRNTVGRFVTENTAIIEECRNEMAKNIAKAFIKNMSQLSISPEQAIKIIEEEKL